MIFMVQYRNEVIDWIRAESKRGEKGILGPEIRKWNKEHGSINVPFPVNILINDICSGEEYALKLYKQIESIYDGAFQ